jgi:aminoglycoside phosphotransferase (APT) family kinase protein
MAIARVRAVADDGIGRAHGFTFVVKRLDGPDVREEALYAVVLERSRTRLAPRLLGSEPAGPRVTYLYLEYVRPARAWPWTDVALAGRVLAQLAHVHQVLHASDASQIFRAWDYEAELRGSAEATVEVFERVVAHESLASFRAARGALRRTLAALPAVRRTLLETEPFGTAVLHGDVHSGNVITRTHAGMEQVVLLDWGRARLGSPLEDVSSWLQSLGYWEPEAKRRHDTLLRHYLAARGHSTVLGRSLRDAYWLAGACNVLAGALRYYLLVADGWGPAPSRTRAEAARAARDQLRVIRRADAVWRR